MKKGILVSLAIMLMTLVTNVWALSDEQAAQSTIENWFAAMKNNQIDQASSYLSPQFVSIHTDGIVRNKAEEIQLMKNLKMKEYSLTNFKFSRSGDAIVVTYVDKTKEQIDNKPVSEKSAGRMAVLQKNNDKWIILAYANLDRIM